MAEQSVPNDSPESEKAITEHYIDTAWEKSPLPTGVRNRLRRVDRALAGINAIQRVLMADHLGKMDSRDTPGISYDGLNGGDVDGLRLAVVALGDMASWSLEAIRDNVCGIAVEYKP